jgi:hypothetical protein
MRPAVSAILFAALFLPAMNSAQGASSATTPAAATAGKPAASAGGMTRDAYIHRAEERAGRRAGAHFDRMDTNHDGVLQQSEIDAWRAAHPRHRRVHATKPKAPSQ